MNDQPTLPEREAMEVDIVIVGAGPAGLAAAIRLKQLAAEAGRTIEVTVLEKGSEVGAHILSGAVIDPVSLNQLIPDWKEKGAPLDTPVTSDKFLFLTETGAIGFPNFLLPPLMSNHGSYIVSLGNLARWLAEQAEALGVEVYPGFAAAELLYDKTGAVSGVATGDMGIGRDGAHKDTYMRGMALKAKYTLIGEGARGSLAKQLMAKYELNSQAGFQTYGIGLKELWQVDPAKHKPGAVMHSYGWPLKSSDAVGGSFIYHFDDNLISTGFVVNLNYKNPYISPFDEFQRFKTHPKIRDLFEGARRIAYGARALTQGGLQSVPQLSFPGGALIGCAAGFVNVPRIKGTHNAIYSGMMAAEAAFAALGEGRANDRLESYDEAYKSSPVYKDLHKVRNVKPLTARFGAHLGVALGGLDMWLNTLLPGLSSWTLNHARPDHETLKPASECTPIDYPKPDGKISFDKLSSVFLSSTNHEEDQPVHLVLGDPDIPINRNLADYDEPATRYCPAGVYEILRDDDGSNPRFQINAQNCVHCKTCDIKDPAQNITWVVPEGGGGPNYPNM
jgi:electron-transferring-flavoprotein dehydrogenase